MSAYHTIHDEVHVSPSKMKLVTREQKVQALKDLQAGTITKDDLKPQVHITQYFEERDDGTIVSCHDGKTYSNEDEFENRARPDCTSMHVIMFVNFGEKKIIKP